MAAKKKLSKKQLAQRKYAARVKTLRARAKTTKGGKGKIVSRAPARKLRRKLGLKKGRAKPRKKK